MKHGTTRTCESCGDEFEAVTATQCSYCRKGAVKPPTPDEIRERCAEIQDDWDATQERNRRGVLAGDDDRLTIPQVKYHA